VDASEVLARIGATGSPLVRQLLMAGLITRQFENRGKAAPVIIGGLALSYYSRETYFTADIDLACTDREHLDVVLRELGFARQGRYWIHGTLDIAVEASASTLAGEEAPRETVELDGGLHCVVIGLEDLIVDRLNACKHWKSEGDCEAAELLVVRYRDELDWDYLEQKAACPENDLLTELRALRERGRP
jgi:hypothetical protein